MKIWIEICLVSARGLRRTSLFKLQWFALGWIDPSDKYCTKIETSGNTNPVWKTKFLTSIDVSESTLHDLDLRLHVEVYSREPIFLRQSLLGSATVELKEFVEKYVEVLKPVEEIGSFQLRKKNSNKPQGFVDVSVRVSGEREDPRGLSNSSIGGQEGFNLLENSGGINLASGYGLPQMHHSLQLPENNRHPSSQYIRLAPIPPNNLPPSSTGLSYPPANVLDYQPPRTHPPPPPRATPAPSHAGYMPTFFPRNENPSTSYINMPPSIAPPGRGFGMGVGAGALAAGAVIFGDDFISGFNLQSGSHDASLTISADPPF